MIRDPPVEFVHCYSQASIGLRYLLCQPQSKSPRSQKYR